MVLQFRWHYREIVILPLHSHADRGDPDAYEIVDWKQAGLAKTSYVRMAPGTVPASHVISQIGSMTAHDQRGITESCGFRNW